MTATGNTILYRYTNPGDDYRSNGFTDKIEMDLGLIPDATGHIKQTRWMGQVSLQENPQPTQNRPHDVQDLGVSWFTPQIAGFIEDPKNTLVAAKILTWFSEPKQNPNYPFGRFGIRTNDFPPFSTEPTATYGFNFEYFEITRDAEYAKLDLIMHYKYNGAISGIGVQRV